VREPLPIAKTFPPSLFYRSEQSRKTIFITQLMAEVGRVSGLLFLKCLHLFPPFFMRVKEEEELAFSTGLLAR